MDDWYTTERRRPGDGHAKAIPEGRRNYFRSLFELKAPDIRTGARTMKQRGMIGSVKRGRELR